MLGVYAEITPALDTLARMRDRTVRSPALMATAYKRAMTRLATRAVQKLRVEPAPRDTTGITRLMTRRQARYVHLLREQRGGGDYVRTHAIARGWKQRVNALHSGGEVVIFNQAPGVTYVEGFDQQPFLAALGWLYAPPILAEFSQQADDVAVQTWLTAADPFAGVPR